ncbi:MAG: N-acetyltransferase [Pyrinomonadaceae bacterium]|nr:N-acetyltransferase [Sphingobacteriaceae bacterium]
MNYIDIPLVHNPSINRFELTIDDHTSFIDYKKNGDSISLLHTEVPPQLEGKGVAASMVEKTFQYVEEHNLKLIPSCSYVQMFLKRHPEWERLL